MADGGNGGWTGAFDKNTTQITLKINILYSFFMLFIN